MFIGFGFVGFDSEETVEKLAQARFHTINGKSVSVFVIACAIDFVSCCQTTFLCGGGGKVCLP